MSEVHGGRLIARSLKREGIEFIFSLPGHGVDHIWDACIDEGIRIIDTRHEQAAAQMADGWARATGRPGVAVFTGAMGLTSAINAITNAQSSPVIVISELSNFSQFDMGAVQEMDQLSLMRPITKWARTVYETRRIPEYVSMAFRHALTGQPGPVFLDIPQDLMEGKVDESQVLYPSQYRTDSRPAGDPRDIQKAVELLAGAKRPVVIAGTGLRWSQGGEELRELIEIAHIPLILRDKARGCVPEDHPLCFGPALVGLRQADVILAVGIQFNYWLKFGRAPLFNEKAKVIQIDSEASTIGHNRPVEVGVVGDAKAILKQMAEEARERRRAVDNSAWIQACQREYLNWRQHQEAGADSDTVPIQPARLLQEVARFLDRDAIVVVDGGQSGRLGRGLFKAYHPGQLIDHHPLACLGSGIPFGLSAKLANPDSQVLVYTGDGAFGFNTMEMDTAVRHNIPVVVVVSNNGCWATCKRRQEQLFGRHIGTTLNFTRYDKVVADLGGYGEWVEKPDDIVPALRRAFASSLPACVNVKTDPDVIVPGGASE